VGQGWVYVAFTDLEAESLQTFWVIIQIKQIPGQQFARIIHNFMLFQGFKLCPKQQNLVREKFAAFIDLKLIKSQQMSSQGTSKTSVQANSLNYNHNTVN